MFGLSFDPSTPLEAPKPAAAPPPSKPASPSEVSLTSSRGDSFLSRLDDIQSLLGQSQSSPAPAPSTTNRRNVRSMPSVSARKPEAAKKSTASYSGLFSDEAVKTEAMQAIPKHTPEPAYQEMNPGDLFAALDAHEAKNSCAAMDLDLDLNGAKTEASLPPVPSDEGSRAQTQASLATADEPTASPDVDDIAFHMTEPLQAIPKRVDAVDIQHLETDALPIIDDHDGFPASIGAEPDVERSIEESFFGATLSGDDFSAVDDFDTAGEFEVDDHDHAPPKKKNNTGALMALVVLVAAGAAVAIWFFVLK